MINHTLRGTVMVVISEILIRRGCCFSYVPYTITEFGFITRNKRQRSSSSSMKEYEDRHRRGISYNFDHYVQYQVHNNYYQQRLYSITSSSLGKNDAIDSTATIPNNITNTSSITNCADEDLMWERFEFSDSPKLDSRFGIVEYNHTNTSEMSKEDLLDKLHKQETIYDQQYAQQLNKEHTAYMDIDPETVQAAIGVLEKYVQPERIQRIHSVLQKRTNKVRFLFENPSNPSNVYACLRTIDAFGIQNVDIIIQSDQYRGKAAIYQKKNMRTAMGSAKWLTVTNYESTEVAVRTLKERYNCRLYASDLNPSAIDIRNIDWANRNNIIDPNSRIHSNIATTEMLNDHTICIVMGNEDTGISDTMRGIVDETFTLPMFGFAESFNLSVAVAIILAHLSAKSNQSFPANEAMESVQDTNTTHQLNGQPLQLGSLNQYEYKVLYMKGLINSLPQRRLARPLLQKAGIFLSKELNI